MSARVYLMADFGKGPRSTGTIGSGWWYPNRLQSNGRICHKSADPRGWPLRPRQVEAIAPNNAAEASRAWWVVEAESADAARRCIKATAALAHSHPGGAR